MGDIDLGQRTKKARSPERRRSRERRTSASRSKEVRSTERKRSRTREEKGKGRNRSPSLEIMRKKSLSPGTKEILAYKAEQERAMMKKSKKSKASLYSDDEIEEIPTFAKRVDAPEVKDKDPKFDRLRHLSGDSHDEVERLRLQALSSLKSRDNSDQSDYKSPKKKI